MPNNRGICLMTAECLSTMFAGDICAWSTVELTASRIFLQVYWGSLVPSPIYVEWAWTMAE